MPVHEDRTPSFRPNPDSGLWYCHGCGVGGDILTFVERAEGLDFRGAFSKLASIAGLPGGSQAYEPTLEFKLAGGEASAFDHWLYLNKQRLQHRWLALDDDLKACQTFIEQFWSEEENPDRKNVEAVHRHMNYTHEAKHLIEKQLDRLEMDPLTFVEPFLRRFYSNKDVRALAEVA